MLDGRIKKKFVQYYLKCIEVHTNFKLSTTININLYNW